MAVLFAMLAVATPIAALDVSVGDLASATTSAFLLGLAFAMVAFTLSAATGGSDCDRPQRGRRGGGVPHP